MHKIIHVIPGANHGGDCTQLRLLVGGLPRGCFDVRVCVLGRRGPVADALAAAGVNVTVLGWRRWFDVQPILSLRRSVREFAPDLIHAWGATALQAVNLALAGGQVRCPRVVNAPLSLGKRPAPFAERWSLRRADRVVIARASLADDCRRYGIDDRRLALIPCGVETPATADQAPPLAGLPAHAPVIACVGPFTPDKGPRDAVWAYDILRYLYRDLQLLLIGAGPETEEMRRFVRIIGAEASVHWLGERTDVPRWLRLADVVWVPSRTPAGINVALEALACGIPIVATRVPGLVEIIRDGENGFLVAAGDKPDMARQTRRLLEDPALRRRMGECGKDDAVRCHAAALVRRNYIDLYESVLSA